MLSLGMQVYNMYKSKKKSNDKKKKKANATQKAISESLLVLEWDKTI